MDKHILEQYCDLQEEIKQVRERIDKTEREIQKLEEEKSVFDTVSGGSGGNQHYKIEGFPYPQYSRKKTLLFARKATLTTLEMDLLEATNGIEEFIASLNDSQMRRIISLRFLDRMSWRNVAQNIGGGNTEDSVRMAFERFMKKQ